MSKENKDLDNIVSFISYIVATYIVLQMGFCILGMIYGYTAKDPRCLPENIFGRINVGFNAGCELTKPRFK